MLRFLRKRPPADREEIKKINARLGKVEKDVNYLSQQYRLLRREA